MDEKPRFRINAHQSAKGAWQFDATVEYHSDQITAGDLKDTGATTTLGLKLLSLIKETEKAFRDDNRKIVENKQ